MKWKAACAVMTLMLMSSSARAGFTFFELSGPTDVRLGQTATYSVQVAFSPTDLSLLNANAAQEAIQQGFSKPLIEFLNGDTTVDLLFGAAPTGALVSDLSTGFVLAPGQSLDAHMSFDVTFDQPGYWDLFAHTHYREFTRQLPTDYCDALGPSECGPIYGDIDTNVYEDELSIALRVYANPVPEPDQWALMLAGGSLLFGFRSRRLVGYRAHVTR
ncbi:MAG TPA: PEP-CTERM sorting domain-containing protein [Burkholderiales bacterium]|nr:PEP-CTERM sorting domain-containing protein [Burkholderiales bacterium]